MAEPREKRQRVDDEAMEHCQYFVQRKKRFCRMTVRKGNKFCGEHTATSEEANGTDPKRKRVPCPVDSTHTCYESRLAQHLKVCNTRRQLDARPGYIVEGVNRGNVAESPRHMPLNLLDEAVVDSVIERVEAAYEKLPEVEELILQHDVLDAALNNASCGNNAKKHLVQNSSLLGHVSRAGLVREGTCFIEFGAGRGKLSYWLAQMLRDTKDSTILLVDRSSHRHKSDNKLKNESSSINTIRIRADIADLVLSKVPEIKGIKRKVGVAKHLCGAATDLTIRCLSGLIADDAASEFSGLVVAFCCHHRCDYASYVGHSYLKTCGFAPDEFSILCSVASWATCGTGKNREAQREPDHDAKWMRRETIGRKVKALLNWGRVEYLRGIGYSTHLYYYTTPEVSLENMCVVAIRRAPDTPK